MLTDADSRLLDDRVYWFCWCWCLYWRWRRVDDFALLCCRLFFEGLLGLPAPREYASEDREQNKHDHDTARCDASPDAHMKFDHFD